MNGLIRRYFSPVEAPAAPPGTPPATPPGTPPATPPASPPAAPPAGPDFFIKADGSYTEKFWEHPSFPAELKDNMQIRTHKTVADTYANWLGMHKSQGLEKILIPGKDAKPEVWDANVWQRLGTPKEAKDYKVPDFAATGLDPKFKASDAEQQAFLNIVHEARLTDWQFQKLTGGMNALLRTNLEASAAAAKTAAATAMQPIRARLGGQFEQVRTGLETFLRSTVKPEAFEGAKAMLEDPGTFEWLEKIAPAFAEAQADLTAANTPSNVLADYDSQVAKLTASEAYTQEYHKEHVATVAKVNELRKVLFAARGKK